MLRVALLVAASVLLAGCAQVPARSARLVPEGAPSVGGSGDAMWTVHVTDHNGFPFPQAQVTAYWVHRAGVLNYVDLRTGEDGLAKVNAPIGRNITVAASAAGWTEAWRLSVPTAPRQVDLQLLPQRLTFNITGTWTVAGDQGLCQLHEFTYGTGPVATEFLDRVSAAELTLTWTNEVPHGIGDWELGYLVPGTFEVFSDCPEASSPASHASLGSQSSRLSLGRAQWEEMHDSFASTVLVGPVDAGATAALGLPYTIEVNATLERDAIYYQELDREYAGWDLVPAGEEGPIARQSPLLPLIVVVLAALWVAAWRRSRI